MINLNGKRALITGGTQGVGSAIAIALAKAGADVVIHGLTIDDPAQATAVACRDAGVNVSLIEGDLSGPTASAVKQVFDRAKAAQSGIDILINNAGTYADSPFLEMTHDSFERTMRLNVFSYFFLTQSFAREWVSQHVHGRVLMIGSINGRLAESTHSGYDTSKGAVEMMVKTLCVELAPHGIRVVGLAPGMVDTDSLREFMDDDTLARRGKGVPAGRIAKPEDLGKAAVMLASDLARWVYGDTLVCDGGESLASG